MPADPLYGFTSLKQMYIKADPGYAARFTVPMLWDRQRETVVSNESADIIRMLYSAFDALLPPERREAAHPLGGYLPGDAKLRGEIEAMNEWVYDAVNNGVYKTGFAAEQAVYSKHLHALFKGLDRLEAHLASPDKPPGPYLFGEHITEADIRLYPTIVRFDVAYHSTFKCNLGMIRQDYPLLDRWLRTVYWNNEAFKETTVFEPVKLGRNEECAWDHGRKTVFGLHLALGGLGFEHLVGDAAEDEEGHEHADADAQEGKADSASAEAVTSLEDGRDRGEEQGQHNGLHQHLGGTDDGTSECGKGGQAVVKLAAEMRVAGSFAKLTCLGLEDDGCIGLLQDEEAGDSEHAGCNGDNPKGPTPAGSLGQKSTGHGSDDGAYVRWSAEGCEAQGVANSAATIGQHTGASNTFEETESNEHAQVGGDGTCNGKDDEEDVGSVVDDGTTVELRHGCNDQGSGGIAENVDGDNEAGEDEAVAVEVFHDLADAGCEHGRGQGGDEGQGAQDANHRPLLPARPIDCLDRAFGRQRRIQDEAWNGGAPLVISPQHKLCASLRRRKQPRCRCSRCEKPRGWYSVRPAQHQQAAATGRSYSAQPRAECVEVESRMGIFKSRLRDNGGQYARPAGGVAGAHVAQLAA
ncbi:hypothetical protein FH972_023214 [Carpinus fangiana]|uniref:GST C-terminal domain-containing protein n=1 Tax=Carpinus fangiana TaxID=176857 RepID=A0A5N6KV58_9ROSI|nr:hypothetical protein FH972_023214 [Carpinus fangiana]